jgi:uncharacterized protein (DUF1786 family)
MKILAIDIGAGTQDILLRHLQKGYRVVMEESAAYSIRNDLGEVRSMGIQVGKNPGPIIFKNLRSGRLIYSFLRVFLSNFGEDLEDDRDLFKGTDMKDRYSAPGGNTMMTGPVGLVKATLYRFGNASNRA